ncbi:uroporphyrinogen-III synthase [Aequorivita sp. Q41]|uniref:uroporphyrinogen-III synthase n=1 Tax=Aequorivita sp. Q41 TaxID=3153300 RepID=UPI0032420E3D
MKSVLSTKKLSTSQRELLINANTSLVDYNAITINFKAFKAPTFIENAIFTSQNAFLAIQDSKFIIQNCFCVGEKTKLLLDKNNQKVVKKTEYASELADYLVKNHKNDSFYFFCGNIRSDEIPSKLKDNTIAFEEIQVYTTSLNPKHFEKQFDAVLFFSPSGVRSFFLENNSIQNNAICIGNTTASEAKKYTKNVVISNTTTVESVLAKTVEIFKKHD